MSEETAYIYGRNAVWEAIAGNGKVAKIFIAYGVRGDQINAIYSRASKSKIPCVVYDKRKFIELESKVCPKNVKSQGVIALRELTESVTVMDLIKSALKKPNPLILLLDEINDPHNLGAIARSAECAGAAGIILPERNSSPITPVAIKTSAGALEYIPVAYTSNLNTAITKLKENGFWIVGTSDKADKNYTDKIYGSPIGLIIGNEGKGIRPSISKHCDHLVRIPLLGKISSLNASAAASVIMFEILRQKLNK